MAQAQNPFDQKAPIPGIKKIISVGSVKAESEKALLLSISPSH